MQTYSAQNIDLDAIKISFREWDKAKLYIRKKLNHRNLDHYESIVELKEENAKLHRAIVYLYTKIRKKKRQEEQLTEQQTEPIFTINEAAEPIINTNEATIQELVIDSNEAASQTFIALYNIFEESIISKEVSQEQYLDILFRSVIADNLIFFLRIARRAIIFCLHCNI